MSDLFMNGPQHASVHRGSKLPPPLHFIEVSPRVGGSLRDVRADLIRRELKSDHHLEVGPVRSIMGYQIRTNLDGSELERSVLELFTDPVLECGCLDASLLDDCTLFPGTPSAAIMVGFRPGVTDNRASAAMDGLSTLYPGLDEDTMISTTITYVFEGTEGIDLNWLANQLHNPLIEQVSIADSVDCELGEWPLLDFPAMGEVHFLEPTAIDLEVDDEVLVDISQKGLLALSLEEMLAIQAHYRDEDVRTRRAAAGLPESSPTDVELECLAQTWSEHCKHKIFAARIDHLDEETGEREQIDSLFKTNIMSPTLEMSERVDWLLSVFHDNSGVIAWNDDWSICMKAETHNSPSALDPFGGAITGIVGVNRDILGTGLGARPIANTDVFCFGPPDYSGRIPAGLFHPSRVLRGVHAGVRAGGNESGIPTVNGAMVFDERYIGKPLVYCGTVGIMPRHLPDGRESHIKTPHVGDTIYMVGGRVGSDGIHGATFSSMELTEESPSSAVQIGDPITQKKMVDMLLEARDAGLIQVITDNGAGGLSSSVGEMAELTGGAEIDLAKVPLKQAGLSAWEILISESQERMTVGVSPEDEQAFEELAELHEVEATEIGIFTDSGTFQVDFAEHTVALLPIDFLHNGVPQLRLTSVWSRPHHLPPNLPTYDAGEMGKLLERLMARPNIASKEWWVRQYDHEVLAQSVIKPFCGVECDAPGDAAVIAPMMGETQGIVISCGIAPRYSDIDTYSMAAASVDEAVRNAVCVGVDLDRMAGLDNFCWPDSIESEKTPDGRYKLAQLVRANKALEEVCRAYSLPCISGKDSMKNDVVMHGEKISVPPTMLFSLIGNHRDVRRAVSSDFKRAGDMIFLLGETHQELGASELACMLADEGSGGIGGDAPRIDAERNLILYRALSEAMSRGLVASAHDCSDGGLAAALAECCFGSGTGCEADLSDLLGRGSGIDAWGAMFSESLGRFVITVAPADDDEFTSLFTDMSCTRLGEVGGDDCSDLVFTADGGELLRADINELKASWKATLDGGAPR